MKKHAVFLRGIPRTWNHIKEHTIDFFNENLDMPDWYVCFWESQTTNIEQLTKDFLGSNLKCLIIKTDDFEKFDAEVFWNAAGEIDLRKFSMGDNYWRVAYLDHILSMEKRKQELLNHFVYDTVTFIRPDVFYHYCDSVKSMDDIKRLEGFEVVGLHWNGYKTTLDLEQATTSFWTNDFCFSGASIPADILGTRFFDCKYNNNFPQFMNINPHNLLGLVVTKYQFVTIGPGSLMWRLTRPNHFYYDKLEKKYLLIENRPHEILPWDKVENENKNKMYKLLDIDPKDYG